MPAARKKSTKKSSSKAKPAARVSWADAMKQALDTRRTGGGPEQARPRDSAVKKLKTGGR